MSKNKDVISLTKGCAVWLVLIVGAAVPAFTAAAHAVLT